MSRTANIAFWGPDVSKISTLVHSLKTGKYTRPHQQSIHPYTEELTIEDVTVKAAIPSANEGSRRGWRSLIFDYDGIVYVVQSEDPSSSKEELHGLLGDESLAKPLLILVPKSDTTDEAEVIQQLALPDAAQGGQKFALFTYIMSDVPSGEAEKAFRWLLQQI